ncbi:MAG: hypothetical protein AMXMBFR13_33560 [Phycisphaerae bacterium]
MSDLPSTLQPQVFRRTNKHEGWREVFSPRTGALQYLTYARLVFGPEVRAHALPGDETEWSIFCIQPPATVIVEGQRFELGKHDILYVPRRKPFEISGPAGSDLALGGSPAHIDAEPQLVRFHAIKDDPAFCIDVGSAELHTQRRIYNMLGTNVKASRLLAGFTVGTPGAWTSWPPHEHQESKEEFYLFFDMPDPAFSVQFVYSTPDQMGFAPVVRDGDCVSIPHGYHPTAAAPGFRTVFHWVMAAYDPDKHRDLRYGINVQPEYQNIKFL